MFDVRNTTAISAGWNDLLRPYEIKVRDELLDEWLNVATGRTSSLIYPQTYATHPVTRDLPTFVPVFPAPCALEVSKPNPPQRGAPFYVATPLIQTSPGAWGEASAENVTRENRFDPDADLRGPIVSRRARRRLSRRPIRASRCKEAEGARLVIIANSFFAGNTAFPRFRGTNCSPSARCPGSTQRAFRPRRFRRRIWTFGRSRTGRPRFGGSFFLFQSSSCRSS